MLHFLKQIIQIAQYNTTNIVSTIRYARLYLDGNLQMWVDAEDSLEL